MNKVGCFYFKSEEFEYIIINLFFILQHGNRDDSNLWTGTFVDIYRLSYLQNQKKKIFSKS